MISDGKFQKLLQFHLILLKRTSFSNFASGLDSNKEGNGFFLAFYKHSQIYPLSLDIQGSSTALH